MTCLTRSSGNWPAFSLVSFVRSGNSEGEELAHRAVAGAAHAMAGRAIVPEIALAQFEADALADRWRGAGGELASGLWRGSEQAAHQAAHGKPHQEILALNMILTPFLDAESRGEGVRALTSIN